jgi:hypothetical protein
MKKLALKNYLLIAFFALLVAGVIYLSVVSRSVKYFGYFVLALAALFAAGNLIQRNNPTNTRHYRSRSREQLLRHQFRK